MKIWMTAIKGYTKTIGLQMNQYRELLLLQEKNEGLPLQTLNPETLLLCYCSDLTTFLATGPRSLSSTSKLTSSPSARVLKPPMVIEEK